MAVDMFTEYADMRLMPVNTEKIPGWQWGNMQKNILIIQDQHKLCTE
jgi:hypothetical protein